MSCISFLRLPDFGKKNIRLHLETHIELLSFSVAFNYLYLQYLAHHHIELANISATKPQVLPDKITFGLGASLGRNKFNYSPGFSH